MAVGRGNKHEMTMARVVVFGLGLGVAHVIAFGGALVLGLVFSGVSPTLTVTPIAAVTVLLVTWICLRALHGRPLAMVGIGLDRPWARHLALGTVVGVILIGVMWMIFRSLLGAEAEVRPINGVLLRSLLVAVFSCLAGAAHEELMFRGYLLQIIGRRHLPLAIVLTGLGFVAIHLSNRGGMEPLTVANCFLAHLLFTAAYLRTRSLWLPIGLHAGWNFAVAFIFGMPMSGRVPKYSLMATSLPRDIWNGFEFGPEGGLIATLLFAVGAMFLWKLFPQQHPALDLLSMEAEAPRVPEARVVGPSRLGSPGPQLDRIQAIDVLRGVALLGILPWNMQLFAMIDVACFNPFAAPWTDSLNLGVWALLHLVVGHKDILIFSMLFGAGIAMISDRDRAEGGRLHGRRMLALLVIGLLHACLIWSGDILMTYALCGLLVYLFRAFPPRGQVALGLAAYSVPMAILLASALIVPILQPETLANVNAVLQPSAETIAEHNALWRQGWLAQCSLRAKELQTMQTVLVVVGSGWVAGGMMLCGLGFQRMGAFAGRLSDQTYRRLILLLVVAGLPLIVLGLVLALRGFELQRFQFSLLAVELASPIMALGWMAIVVLACRRESIRRISAPLAAVGRMALTNYLVQSLVCAFIFYGHGLGWVGRVNRVGLLGITAAIWIAQLAYSPIWLRNFRFGPAEWLWRTMTYGRRQPMTLPVGAAAPTADLAPRAAPQD